MLSLRAARGIAPSRSLGVAGAAGGIAPSQRLATGVHAQVGQVARAAEAARAA